ncbi:putative ribonuclease H-like domain-containing protein [Tanacetum coccineum]
MAKKSILKNIGKNTGQREIRPVWNSAQRINHQNKFIPSAVLTRFGRVPVSVAKQNSLRATTSTSTFRPVNTATHTNRVNVSKLRTKAFHKSQSPIRRPFYKSTSPNTRISNKKVNTVRVNGVNTAGQTAVSAVKGTGVTAVKASTGCVWRPKMTDLNNVSKDNSGSWVSKRFWNTATTKTVNSVKQIHAIVEDKAVVISESLVRSDLLFNDEDGITSLTNDEIFENLALMGYEQLSTKLTFQKEVFNVSKVGDEAINEEMFDSMERAITTDASLDAAHDSDNITKTQSTKTLNEPHPQGEGSEGHTSGSGEGKMEHQFELTANIPITPHNSPLLGGYTLGSDEGRLKLQELMTMCIKLSKQVLELEKEKDDKALEIPRLKKRVKSSDDDLDEEDASKQVRKNDKTNPMLHESDINGFDDETVDVATTGVSTVSSPVTIAGTLIKMKEEKAKEKGVAFKDVEDSSRPVRSITTLQPLPSIDPKDKGKGILVEGEPVKVKRKDQGLAQIESDAELAHRLHEEELAEIERIQKEKAAQEEVSMAAIYEEYDTIQASIDADALFAAKLQQEDREQYTIEERAKFLAETIAAQRKFRAAQRAAEIRSRPPTKTQLRNLMMTYLKNMGGYKHSQLKGKTYEEIQGLYEREQKFIHDFVPMDSEKEEKKSMEPESEGKKSKRLKRTAGSYATQKSPKKPKVMKSVKNVTEEEATEYEKEKEELRLSLKIISGNDSEVNYEPLSRRFPIMNWEYKLLGNVDAKDMYVYKLTRADGSSSYHGDMQTFLRRLDMQDLNDLYRRGINKKNYVLFTDSECLVLSPNFKLPDESQVLLKIPRQNNMYSFDMKNIVPKDGLTCLVAKATSEESMLWHRRLGHVNFKNINKLVKDNLVRDLPLKRFENDQTCVACLKGKQHRASCKTKAFSPSTKPLFMLHMDLFGPTFVSSLMHKKYCLVVTDDFSRFSWVFFLRTKDETSEILKNFIKEIENLVDKKVKIIRSDNGTEFKNHVMDEFCREKGIKREYSVARTPQQNGVAERKNRTLIEAARTMLADSKLPTTFWAEAVSTACYVQNRVLVVKPHNKTPYELFKGIKPAIGFMKPFGCHVTILNTLDKLGKFEGKSDEGFFVGYSLSSKAFRVYNIRTRKVQENLHVGFLENKPMLEGNGPKWLFDLDSLTQSMNYVPVVAGTFSNVSAGTQGGSEMLHTLKNITPQSVDENQYKVKMGIQRIALSRCSSDPAWVEAMQENSLHSSYKMYGFLVDVAKSARGQLATKYVYRNQKDERELFIMKDKFSDEFPWMELTFFLGLPDVKSASTPTDLERPLVKDSDADDVDEHLYRSMIGIIFFDVSYSIRQNHVLQLIPPWSRLHILIVDYAGATLDKSQPLEALASPEQTATGKDFSNPFIVGSLLKTIWSAEIEQMMNVSFKIQATIDGHSAVNL